MKSWTKEPVDIRAAFAFLSISHHLVRIRYESFLSLFGGVLGVYAHMGVGLHRNLARRVPDELLHHLEVHAFRANVVMLEQIEAGPLSRPRLAKPVDFSTLRENRGRSACALPPRKNLRRGFAGYCQSSRPSPSVKRRMNSSDATAGFDSGRIRRRLSSSRNSAAREASRLARVFPTGASCA